MSKKKKQVRESFRDAVFSRDKYSCKVCGKKFSKKQAETELDAHHIIDRNDLPNQGMIRENGISLCKACHEEAEKFHRDGITSEKYMPENLFALINSGPELALISSIIFGKAE